MATITTCDGTGVEIPNGTLATGYFGHKYSDEARPIAEEYLAELNALHARSASAFTAELATLRARYSEKLRQLPDLP